MPEGNGVLGDKASSACIILRALLVGSTARDVTRYTGLAAGPGTAKVTILVQSAAAGFFRISLLPSQQTGMVPVRSVLLTRRVLRLLSTDPFNFKLIRTH